MNYKIIYEDKDIIVCHKMAGLSVQTGKIGVADLVSELKNYLMKTATAKPAKEPYLGVVHRLDQPVEGLILFAKNQAAAGELSKQLTTGIMNKHYYAVAAGVAKTGQGTLTDYLVKDAKTNTSSVTTKDKGKESKLEYTLIKQANINQQSYSLYDIHLLTGRHHQIRVQMANAGLPLLGDRKYGGDISDNLSNELGVKNVALCAYKLEFVHPSGKKKTEFKIQPEGKIFEQFLPNL